MLPKDTRVLVLPFTRQTEAEDIVIGNPRSGVFIALSQEAVEVLDWLAAGKTTGETEQAYSEKHGEVPDLGDFLGLLQEKGLVQIGLAAGPSVGSAALPKSPSAHPPAVRYHFTNIPQSLAAKLFSKATLLGCAMLFAMAVLAVLLDPSLLPGPRALRFSEHGTAKMLVLMLIGYATIFVHEMGHLLAARAVGVDSRLGVGHRMWILVAETDLTGLWAVEKSQRYLPILAGLLVDIASSSLLVLALATLQLLRITPPATLRELVMALVFVYLLRILWQMFFFVRTDLYYALANLFGCKNLMRDTQIYLWSTASKLLFRKPAVDLSQIPARELKLIRFYVWLWLLGRILALVALFFVTLPLAAFYLQSSARTLLSWSNSDLYALLDAALILLFFIAPLTAGLALWSRSLYRHWRDFNAKRAIPAQSA